MNITIPINTPLLKKFKNWIIQIPETYLVTFMAAALGCIATFYSLKHNAIVAYGDAESHLNIAKRVVHSLTPGAAQLGGIWLPLPHLLMVPFVAFDFLWRTGLAGSIVSGICYIITGMYLYKLTYFLTKNKLAAIIAFLAYALNPNVLYMQSTPMTEFPLIASFMLSTYYFIKYIHNDQDYPSLIISSFFGFCATLSRYDGWFLVLVEAGIIGLMYITNRRTWTKMQGRLALFSTLAFFGILLWLGWDLAILGDPLYFTHSQFSAKSQQQSWLARGELPAYKNLFISVEYYTITTFANSGIVLFIAACVGAFLFLLRRSKEQFFMFLILVVPFIFNVIALYLGQSVIFIPDITPVGYEWRLFNVRYGLLMMPILAFFVGYFFSQLKNYGRMVLTGLLVFQLALFGIGYSRVITLADGTVGLSASKHPEAEKWITQHYDGGLVLLDDYARTISVVRSNIPMQNIIYVGTKPYWDDSLKQPEKYARWIIMQRDDDVWKHIYNDPIVQGRLYKYFVKEYTSPEILIFRRNEKVK